MQKLEAKKISSLLILIALTLTLIFNIGCIATPQKMVESDRVIQNYLSEHPNSTVTVSIYTPQQFIKDEDFWEENCKSTIYSDKNYYLAVVSDSNMTLKALFEKSQMLFICGVIEDTFSKEILSRDNSLTIQTNTCFSKGGIKCDTNQKCSGNWITVTDTTRCCDNLCKTGLAIDTEIPITTPTQPPVVEREICEGIKTVKCTSTQKCTTLATDRNVTCGCSKCTARLCADYQGLICSKDTNCYGDTMVTPDTKTCCLGVCYTVEVTYDTNDTNTN